MKKEKLIFNFIICLAFFISVPVYALDDEKEAVTNNINDYTKENSLNESSLHSLQNGWVVENGYTYYYVNGVKVQGFQEIDGKTYFFSYVNSALKYGLQVLDGKTFYLNEAGEVQYGWQIIGNFTYYFGSDGYAYQGFKEIEGKNYFFSLVNSALKYGIQVLDGKTFYLNEAGEVQYGWHNIGNFTYYFGSDGYAYQGFKEIEGKNYFFSLVNSALKYGWQSIDGKLFYLNESGEVQYGWHNIDGYRYYFGNDGYAYQGFQNIDDKTYFFSYVNSALKYGWQSVDGNIFYLNTNGEVQYGNQTIEGRDYIFNGQGYLQGFTYDNNGNILYYHNPDGSQAKGVQRMAGRYYKFNEITGTFEGYVNQRIVIDVSYHQGTIDWETVKNSGMVDAVILRLGYASDAIDKQFLRNVSELNRLGIPYTVYLFSYAENAWEASLEADLLINTIKNNNVYIDTTLFPIFYDIESWRINDINNTDHLSKSDYESIIMTFINKVESALGIATRVYTNKNYAETRLPASVLPYVTWIAQWYSEECTYEGSYNGWQYTDKGSVPGIKGNVDMNIFYY